MASGFGYSGGRSRCHPFWQEFAKCYASADHPSECSLQQADYLECLHHAKEIKRAQTVKSHYLQQQQRQLAQKKQEAEAKAVTPSGVMSLNLIALKDEEPPAPTKTPGGGKGDKGQDKSTKSQPSADDPAAAKTPKESKVQAS